MTKSENRAIDRQNTAPSDPNHLPGIARVPRLFVNEPGYDDVGRVLRRMGPVFKFDRAENFRHATPANAVLFLNCGSPSAISARGLRQFVEKGGTVYASDQQATFVARAFPEVFRVSKPMDFGDFSATVVDRGLKEALGGMLCLHFDVGDWRFLIAKRSQWVKVYVSIPGSELGLTPQKSPAEDIPIVLGYDVPGGGSVLFTAFHGAAQQSRKIKELIRFLVLRPVMNVDIRTARLTIPEMARTNGLELVGTLRRSMPHCDHAIREQGKWCVSLSWQGTARLRLELRNRNGLLCAAAESSSSRLAATWHVSAGGYVRVCALDISADQIPYCVLISKTVD